MASDREFEKFTTDQLEYRILNLVHKILDKGEEEISDRSKIIIKEEINEWNDSFCNKYKEILRNSIEEKAKIPWTERRQFRIIKEINEEVKRNLKSEYVISKDVLREQINRFVRQLSEKHISIYTNLRSVQIEMSQKFNNMRTIYNNQEKEYIKEYIREKCKNPQPQFGEFHLPYWNYLKDQVEYYLQ